MNQNPPGFRISRSEPSTRIWAETLAERIA
jgi:hypothetical protein